MNLAIEIAGIKLEHPLMNAAGTCKTLEDVKKLARSASAAVVVGSITQASRPGNIGQIYWAGPMFSLNSLGLPNSGADYYGRVMKEMVHVAHDNGKPLFVSVAGFSPYEYGELAERAFDGGADLVELNLGCPNVWDGGVQKRIVSFDAALVEDVLESVEKRVGVAANVSAKISPFSDPFILAEVAVAIGLSNIVKVVAAVNTFPNAFDYDGKQSRITPGGGLAGLAGPALKPIGLGQIRQLKDLLPERIQIIGVGGIMSGQDVLEYVRCGATATQVATAYIARGEKIFHSLLGEMLETAVT